MRQWLTGITGILPYECLNTNFTPLSCGFMARKRLSGDSRFWDAHTYLAGEIADCADYLAKHLKGYPGVLDKTNPCAKIIHSSKVNERKWRNILIEIRDGFRLYEKCDGDFYEWKDGKRPPETKTVDEMIKQLNDPNRPEKQVINKAKLAKFKRAMVLFSKYYEHLWD